MNRMNQVHDVDALCARISDGVVPRFLFFWGHRPSKDGGITKACLSQWFDAPFVVDGTHYKTAEHYMMAAKAHLFNDHAMRARILNASTPAEAKTYGRQIANFDEGLWARERFAIVVAASREKFAQNRALREFLVGTGDQVLVEASPVDPIWGIGLAADHVDAARPDRWPGLNLLGFALMAARSHLRMA